MGSITRGISNNILGNGAVDGTDALSGTIPATNIANATLDNLTAFPPSVSAGIPQVASDPPAPSEGDIWYNTTTYKLKVRGLAAGTWASGTNMPTNINGGVGGGTQNAALVSGGYSSPPGSMNTATFEYDGSTWTAGGTIATSSTERGYTGLQTAALAWANSGTSTATEEYDGTSWASGGALNTGRAGSAGAGIQTAALALGGFPSPNATEEYDGSTWTTVTSMSNGKYFIGGAGSQTAALGFGGTIAGNPAVFSTTEEYDGATWTSGGALNTARSAAQGTGIQTAALAIGGYNGPTASALAATEEYNGNSWTTVESLSTARTTAMAGKGSPNTASIIYGGINGSTYLTSTEEWTKTEGNLEVTLT